MSTYISIPTTHIVCGAFFASSHDVVFVAEEAIESSFSVVGERQVKSSRQKSGTKNVKLGMK